MKKLDEIIKAESFNTYSSNKHWSNSAFDFLGLIRQWPKIIGEKLACFKYFTYISTVIESES